MKPIPQEWIDQYVQTLLKFAERFDKGSMMRTTTLLRAEHAMDLVKAFREVKQ